MRLKATMRAPVACSSERRSIISFMAISFMDGLSSDAGGALHRTHDAEMGSAAAEIVRQLRFDLLFRRLRVVRQQRGGLHDHAVDAVAALHRLLVDEGLLDGVRTLVRPQPFKGYDLAVGNRG